MSLHIHLLLSLVLLFALAQGQGQLNRARDAAGRTGQGRLGRSSDASDTIDWNEVTDNLIQQFKQQILEKDQDEVDIPDLHQSLGKKFGWMVRGSPVFTAMEGRLSSLSSIHRISDVMMSESGNLTFSVLLRFANLKLRYGHYTARVAGVGPSGSLAVRVMDNSVLLRVRIDVDQHGCSLMHEDVEEVTLGGMKLKVTGLGPLNGLASKLATLIAKAVQHDIKAALQQLLDEQLGYILRNTQLDCSS